MARRIKEEQVTKSILKWLQSKSWEIVCYDFPQSGTGRVLHPDNTVSKTDGAIIPDIVAIKDKTVVVFENKDRFVLEDFEKINRLRQTTMYNKSFRILLKKYPYNKIFYGNGMPYTNNNEFKSMEYKHLTDFVVFVSETDSPKTIDGDLLF